MFRPTKLRLGPLLLLLFVFETLGPLRATQVYRLHPDESRQTIWGLGFEIQSDSIGSGNQGLPVDRIAVPHDLTEAERARLADEMLKGFRYCRLAGGLYWRGLDPTKRFLRPRWPDQLQELRTLLDRADVEGVTFEYWSPAPFWKANGRYVARSPKDAENVLRCFGPDFANDPIYHGDVDRFLSDFADAVVTDIATLQDASIPVKMWGLQNEPWIGGTAYSSCLYPDAASYIRTYRAVASAIREAYPDILLFGDTEPKFPDKIAAGMSDPDFAALVDAYVVHIIGHPSDEVREIDARIRAELPARPWFQNEYEYLSGGATPERCLNTVQHIMDSFQLAQTPTWFWIHALKPFKNAEASGFSLGFWKSLEEPSETVVDETFRRWSDGPAFTALPAKFRTWETITAVRGDPAQPGRPYHFLVNQTAMLHLLVEERGEYTPGPEWTATDEAVAWKGGVDRVYQRTVEAGRVDIPAHTGNLDGRFGAPHAVFIEPSDPASFKAMSGVNTPIRIRSQYLEIMRAAAAMKPGHWIYNHYNWNAVGSFVKRMPWDSVAIALDETGYDPDARIFAFRKPNGKLTVVVSNRTGHERDFEIETGLPSATWRGYRYTPEDAGAGTLGVAIGDQAGPHLHPTLPDLSWEFWEQQ